MFCSKIVRLLVSGYLLLQSVSCKIYGTYSTFNPLEPFSSNQTHKHTSTGLITHYSVNAHNHGQHEHDQQAQKRQDYQHPPPVEAQPFTPPQHDDLNTQMFSHGQNQQQQQPPQQQQLQTHYEDPAIAKPFETNHPKNPTPAPTSSGQTSQQQHQGGRMPLYLYNPSLARRLGISTFITGSVLYGLTLLPALLAVGVGSGVGPFAGLMSALTGTKRRKRRHIPTDHWEQRFNNNTLTQLGSQTDSPQEKLDQALVNKNSIPNFSEEHFGSKTSPSPPFDPDLENQSSDLSLYVTKRSPGPYIPSTMHYKYREMPMMDHRGSYRFLGLFENTLEVRKIENSSCRKNLLCNVYKNAIGISDHPTAADFEIALIDTFGIAAERNNHKVDVISMVKYYLDSALVGMTRGGSCSKVFPCVHSTTFFRYFPVAAALGSNGHRHKTTVTPTSPSPLAIPFQDRTKTIKLSVN